MKHVSFALAELEQKILTRITDNSLSQTIALAIPLINSSSSINLQSRENSSSPTADKISGFSAHHNKQGGVKLTVPEALS